MPKEGHTALEVRAHTSYGTPKKKVMAGLGLMPTDTSPSTFKDGDKVVKITDKLPDATLRTCKAECNKFEHCAGFTSAITISAITISAITI